MEIHFIYTAYEGSKGNPLGFKTEANFITNTLKAPVLRTNVKLTTLERELLK